MSRSARGFTLVEVLVALALTGIVTLLMLGALRGATLGLDRLSARVDTFDQRHGIAALLRRELAAAIAAGNGPGELSGFAGEPQRLAFITTAGGAGAGLYRIDLAYAGGELVLTRRAADPTALPQEARSVLARGLVGFRLAYYGAAPPDTAPAWHDRWETARVLPRLVRITSEDGSGRPPILIRLWGADG